MTKLAPFLTSFQWRSRLNYVLLIFLPLALYLLYSYTNPFKVVLAEKSICVSHLTMHQKLNIERAVAKLNGTILRPGERFSFNKLVGPRNSRAGFFSAPSYIGAASYDTLGGGICVISSALYQDALLADLKVIERVPHLRTMQTVEPGLDATVWSGGADLKFINDSSTPIQLCCKLENGCLETSLLGSEIPSVHRQLRRRELQGAHNQIAVEVFKESSSDARDKIAEKTNKIKLVSRDIYFVNSPKHVPQTKPTSNL